MCVCEYIIVLHACILLRLAIEYIYLSIALRSQFSRFLEHPEVNREQSQIRNKMSRKLLPADLNFPRRKFTALIVPWKTDIQGPINRENTVSGWNGIHSCSWIKLQLTSFGSSDSEKKKGKLILEFLNYK